MGDLSENIAPKPVLKNRCEANMRAVQNRPVPVVPGSDIGGEPPGVIPTSRGGKPGRALKPEERRTTQRARRLELGAIAVL